MKVKNEPKNYELMSKPFDSEDDLKAAFAAFDKDLSRIRKKHRIAEILIVKCAYVDDKIMTSMQTLGSELIVLQMAQIAVTNAVKINDALMFRINENLHK
jgi:hypothetical protein